MARAAGPSGRAGNAAAEPLASEVERAAVVRPIRLGHQHRLSGPAEPKLDPGQAVLETEDGRGLSGPPGQPPEPLEQNGRAVPEVDLGCYVQHVNYGFDFATICHK